MLTSLPPPPVPPPHLLVSPTRARERRPSDAAFIQCPVYEWFKPDAYNYSMSKAERARVVEPDTHTGPRHFEAMGTSCEQYVRTVVKPALSATGKVFLLGLTPLPGWTRSSGGLNVESVIFKSINRAFGIHCHKRAQDGAWSLTSRTGIGVVDRYAIVGARRRDMIHPFFNAQFAIVQLMLNHLCPRS